MPKISLTVPNDVLDCVCVQRGYQATIPNPSYNPAQPTDLTAVPPVNPPTIANPESKADFVERSVREYLLGESSAGKQRQRKAARDAEDAADRALLTIAKGTVV